MTTTTAPPLVTLYCPNCGHDDIAGGDTVPGLAGIVGWREYLATRKREPVWDGDTELQWNQQRPSRADAPYCCRQCGEFFAAAELQAERSEQPARKPIGRTARPVAHVVIVIDQGAVQVLFANELVSALVIDRGAIVRQIQHVNSTDAMPDGPAAERVSVEVRREYVDSMFAGQV